MIDMANYALAFSNLILLISCGLAFVSRYDWKQIAQRKSGVIENYERELLELRFKIRRLSEAVDALSREDE